MTREWIGSNLPRSDAYAKVAGKSRYIHDLKFPGMLYGRLLTRLRPQAGT